MRQKQPPFLSGLGDNATDAPGAASARARDPRPRARSRAPRPYDPALLAETSHPGEAFLRKVARCQPEVDQIGASAWIPRSRGAV